MVAKPSPQSLIARLVSSVCKQELTDAMMWLAFHHSSGQSLHHIPPIPASKNLSHWQCQPHLDDARIVGVEASGASSANAPTTTQELIRIVAPRVTVEDVVAATIFQFDFGQGR